MHIRAQCSKEKDFKFLFLQWANAKNPKESGRTFKKDFAQKLGDGVMNWRLAAPG